MKLPPAGWKRAYNLLVPLPSGRWMPVHDRQELAIEHIQAEIPVGESDCFGKKPRPALLREIGLLTCELLFKPARHIQWCFHRVEAFNQTWHANVRLVRSQGRDAIVRLFSVMALNMDLATMLVARRDGDELHHYDLKWLAEQAGMSYDRGKRAYAWLKEQGIVTAGDPICEEHPDGTFSGKACAKRISPSFFAYFGLGEKLKDQRDWASDRLKKQHEQSKQTPQQQEALENMQQQAKLNELEKANKQAAKKATKEPSYSTLIPNLISAPTSHQGAPKRVNAAVQIGNLFSELGWR